MYAKTEKLNRELFVKLKNVNKDSPSISDSSLLESNFSSPFMIIVALFNDARYYKENYVFYSNKLIKEQSKKFKF